MQDEEHYHIFVENKTLCLDIDSLRFIYLSNESSGVSSVLNRMALSYP